MRLFNFLKNSKDIVDVEFKDKPVVNMNLDDFKDVATDKIKETVINKAAEKATTSIFSKLKDFFKRLIGK